MWGLSGLRMHICPSVNKGMCVCVRVCVCSSENDIWFYPPASHLQPMQPGGFCIPGLMICVSLRVPASKTPLDNYLLSLARRGYNQVMIFTQNIPLALKRSMTYLKRGWFFSLYWYWLSQPAGKKEHQLSSVSGRLVHNQMELTALFF